MEPINDKILSFRQDISLMTFEELTRVKKEFELKLGNMILDPDLILKLEIVNTELEKREDLNNGLE